MKRIISLFAVMATLFAIASCNGKKPSEEAVKAEAVKNASALVESVVAGNTEGMQNALAADAAALNTLGIDPEKHADLVTLYDDTYEGTLEDNGIDKDSILKLLKKKGIKIPEAPKAIEAAAETAGEVIEKAEEKVDSAAAAAAAAEEKAKETLAEYAGEVAEEAGVDETLPEEVPYLVVEEKPTFNGGDANDFSKWVNENLTYPEAAKDKGVEGRVVLKFKVDKEGQVKDVTVLRSVDPELEAEAVRVVESSPVWNPGKQAGEPVDVTYTFPVVYKLQ